MVADTARRGEVEKLVNKFIRLVSNEPENGWEEDGDALSKDSFSLYMEEYRDTFESALRLSACVNNDSLEGPSLFDAVYEAIDTSKTDAITKAQFCEYFLVTKARELGLVEVEDSASDEGEGYGDDTFDESPRHPFQSPLSGGGTAESGDDEGYGDDDFETSQSPAASPRARAAVAREYPPCIATLESGFEKRRSEVEKLVNKFVRLVSNEPDSGWEEDSDTLSKESFVLYMEEYRDTFESALRLSSCANDQALEGQSLFDVIYEAIDSNSNGFITKAQFREYFLVTKARELGLVEAEESSKNDYDEDEGYGDDTFDESPRHPFQSPLSGGGTAESGDDEGYGDDDFETSQSPAASPRARAAVAREYPPCIPTLGLGFEKRRSEVEKLVNKFVRLVSNEPDSGWEEDSDALSKESFVLYMEEYRDTFESALRLSTCVDDRKPEGQWLFDAVYDSIDPSRSDAITKAQFREYFLVTKAHELGLLELGESTGSAGDDNGYGQDTFEESATPSTSRVGEKVEKVVVYKEPPATDSATAKTQLPPLPDPTGDSSPVTAIIAADTSSASATSTITDEANAAVQQRAATSMTGSLPTSALASTQPQRPLQVPPSALPLPVVPSNTALQALQLDLGSIPPKVPSLEETLPTDDAAMKTYLARLALTDLIAATALPPPPPPSQPAAPKVEIKRSAEAPMVTAVWPAKEFSESRGTVQRSADDAGNISSNGNSSGGRALAWSTGDLNENVGDKAREGLGRERALMAGFDEVYMDFIQSIASGATGRNLRNSSAESRHSGAAIKERRQLERAFADSLRECFSDPAIVTLVRRATHLRLKQQNRRSDK